VDTSTLVVTAGLAEIAAGSIAMGLGGYLAARSDAEHYAAERVREQNEVVQVPEDEAREVEQILQQYGLSPDESQRVVAGLSQRPQAWVDFMLRFELGLEPPEPGRAVRSALTIGAAYVAGGAIPLLPYAFVPSARTALLFSASVTLVALLVFGALKGRFTGAPVLRSGLQTLLIGGVAAAAAFLLARWVGGQ
jgi:VIT1/CCC1 family predicted Fe2+/Mn2+ transporter